LDKDGTGGGDFKGTIPVRK